MRARDPCRSGWHALRADPLAWLLDDDHPNFLWLVVEDLFRRPRSSAAVQRVLGRASVVEPVASILRDLHPDGSWATRAKRWTRYSGGGWRLLAAVEYGADPGDPRLNAAAERLLAEAPGEGGLATDVGRPPSACLTARAARGMSAIGWERHVRVQEWLAWLDEAAPVSGDGGWGCEVRGHRRRGGGCPVTAVALLRTLSSPSAHGRARLRHRAKEAVTSWLADGGWRWNDASLGHPNLLATDLSEALWALARAEVTYDPRMRASLQHLQDAQDRNARWPRQRPVPRSLPIPESCRGGVGWPSHFITARALGAVLHYAVEAGLPRLFPQPPPQPR